MNMNSTSSTNMADYMDYVASANINNNNNNVDMKNKNHIDNHIAPSLDLNGNIAIKSEVYLGDDNIISENNNNTISITEQINGIIEERVKVDRKRFEQMLNDENEIGCDAESFFKQVMKSTNTQIMWPPKLKPGTKSKKDPHVRITGSPKSINAAKEIIFEQLDTRRNRVTLKMDVAFTDHSHIIGKGGRSIQRVMDETGCHIHFPDSNRTSMAEKSNQVSIAGSAVGVEQSRCRIREMLPITVQFELPLNSGLHSPPSLDPQSPQLQAIQQNYGFTIAFRYENSKSTNSYFASSGIITVAIRGTRSHVLGLRQGINVLIEYLTGFSANSINVPLTMTIDVAVQHHALIMGRANINIRSIMQSTGAVITMPDESAISLGPSYLYGSNHSSTSSTSSMQNISTFSNNNAASSHVRKTAITISGSKFDSVYCAWQELIGCLPLILIFDLKEGQDLEPIQITQLIGEMRQISILIKPKQRQNTKSIVVRGPERDSHLLFEVRRQILNLDESEVPICGDQHAFQLASKLLAMFLPCRFLKSPIKSPDVVPSAPAVRSRPPGLPHPQHQQSSPPPPHTAQPQPAQPHPAQQHAALPQPAQQHPTQHNQQQHHHQQPHPHHQPHQQHQQQRGHEVVDWTHQSQSLFRQKLDEVDDFDQYKVLANKAMQDRPTAEKPRHPTPLWAGFGFSRSTSDSAIKQRINLTQRSESIGAPTNASLTNLAALQSIAGPSRSASKSPGRGQVNLSIADFLGHLGLIQYLSLFSQHDIDMCTLFTLTENDLIDLGLPFLHRRKLMMAMAELKRPSFEAAPGAERSRQNRMSSSCSSSRFGNSTLLD